MNITSQQLRIVPPAGRDPIRIVPLHLSDALASPGPGLELPPEPRLIYRDGPLLTAAQVFTVFWGDAWQGAEGSIAQNVNEFFDFILGSALLDQLSEYSVPGQAIGHGQHIGTIMLPPTQLPRSVSDNAIRHMLQQEIATNPAFPQAGRNTLYFVYLPPGVAIVQGGGRSCQAFCGYHDNIDGQVFYAAMPFPGCAGCTGGLSVPEALTSTSSHELCEAITDPIPGQGWYDDVHGEIGDICAWKTKKVGAYTVQLEWSNRANACV